MHLASVWPWFAAAVALGVLRVVGVPGRLLVGWVVKFVVGGGVLWAVNLLGTSQGINLGVNPASAAAVGFLGFPGLLLVAGSHYILLGSLH